MAALNAIMRQAARPAKAIMSSSIKVVKHAQADVKYVKIKLVALCAMNGIIYKMGTVIVVQINVINVKMDIVVVSVIMGNILMGVNVYLFLKDVVLMVMVIVVLNVARVTLLVGLFAIRNRHFAKS